MPRRYEPEPKKKSTNRIIVIAVIAAVVIVGGLLLINTLTATPPTPQVTSASRDWGSANAPITVVEYADFQCPVCGSSFTTLHKLGPQYMDTGKVRVIFKHFAFIGPESEWTAQASECASDQDKFWAFADYVFSHQAGENVGAFSKNNLKQFAAAVGLDNQKFSACFDSNKYADLVKQQTAEGKNRGVRATPSFFINGQFVEGLPSQQQFAGFFETLLKK